MYQKSSPETIQAMFASIATHYDRGNKIFSLGLQNTWNRKLIKAIGQPKCLLDLCAGTGEIAFGYLRTHPHAEAILLDFCPEMLRVAQTKGAHFKERFHILQADAQAIPLADASVDAVTIAYGIRNVKDPQKCFSEVYRVLKPGSSFAILEATRPTSFLPRLFHSFYTRYALPLLGTLAAKNTSAYKYLNKSVQTFDSPEQLLHKLALTGFQHLAKKPLTFGSVTLLTAKKL